MVSMIRGCFVRRGRPDGTVVTRRRPAVVRQEQDRLWFDALERRLALAAIPTATVSGGGSSLIGQEIPLTVTFDNTSSNPGDIGYSPYVDIVMPATGNAPPSPYNGISFKPGSATYNGLALPTTVVTFDAAGKATHPFAKDNAGKPLVVTGKPGDQLVVTKLPFGSYGPAQPPAAINFTGVVSPLAKPNDPYPITATGGFQYQLDANGNPTVDQATVGATVGEAVRPQLFRVKKTSSAPEGETATGPNFKHTYTVSVDVAPGQTITNLQLSDVLPGNVQFVSLTGVSGSQATSITIDSTPSTTVPGGTLARTLNRVVGTASESDAQMTFTYFVPRNDRNGAEVIDLEIGGSATAINQATARGTWTSANPNFPNPQVVVSDPAQHTLTAKTTALQKSAKDITSSATVTRAGDTIEYTINFQVSDFFAVENFFIEDVLTDGQDFDTSFTPTITYRQKSQTFINKPFAPANFTVAVQGDNTTKVDFDVSRQLDSLGLATDGKLLGAGVPNAGTGNPATLPTANPAGPGTSGTITFRTKIRNTYRDGQDVVQGDVISDLATSSATVLDYATLAPTANPVGDTSNAAVVLSSGAMTKSVYAVNGATATGTPSVKAGDSVTFRLTYSLPFSSIKDYTLTDFLPLPIFPAQPLTFVTGSGPSAAVPTAGAWKFGPSDTYRAISGITPANPTVDAAANSLTWSFGTFEDDQNRSATTDILFTVTASNKPFADGLLLTNQGVQAEKNTNDQPLTSTGLAQVKMSEPLLEITKGVVSTNNPSGVFTPTAIAPAGVTFSKPGTTGASFTGTITSGGLASQPIDATLSNVLGNDLVRFCIVVENTGSGPNGAFDVSIKDTFDPAKFQIPTGGLNLRVTNGAGTSLAFGGSADDFFGGGIALVDPSASAGALAPGKTTGGAVVNNGSNMVVITYDLQLLPGVLPSDVIPNTATVTNYATTEGGPNFVPGGISDSTTVTVMAPKVEKTLDGTSIPENGVDKAVIGEKAVYTLRVLLPPGTTTDTLVVDSLPPGLAFTEMVGSPVVDPGVTISNANWATPAVTNSGRTVTFDLGTVTNSATDRSLRGVTLRYAAVVLNVSSNLNFKTLTNSAKLTWTNHTELPAASAAPVTVIEPKLRVTKTPSVSVAQAGDVVTYTIVVAHNADSRADANNVDFKDVIPAGITYVPGSLSNTAGVAPTTLTPPGSGSNPADTFTATFLSLPLGKTSTFTYQAKLDADVVAGAALVNTASETWTSLPGVDPGHITPNNPNAYERTGNGASSPGQLNNYAASTTATVTVAQPTPVKSLVTTSIVNASNSATQAVIGEKATYTITVKIPQGRTPAAKLVDLMPAGLAYVQTISAVNDDPAVLTVPGLSTIPSSVPAGGQTVTYDLGDIVNSDTNPATDETITYTIEAVVLNVATNQSGGQLANQAQVTWNNGASFTNKVSSGPVTVIEPKLTTTKSVVVGGRGGNVGDPVTYTIVVRQSSTSGTDAFDVTLRDVIPAQILNPSLVSVVDTAGVVNLGNFQLTGNTLETKPGGDFDLPKLPSTRTITLTIAGTIAAGVTPGQSIKNTNTAFWTSLDGTPGQISPFNTNSVERTGSGSTAGGQSNNYKTTGSATFAINSADLAVVKTVSNATPNVGDTITFTVTVTNNGPSVANSVQITDQFPVSPELTFLSATASQGSYNSGSGVWNVGTVGVGAASKKTLTITARVNKPTTVGALPATVTNTATVTGVEELDPNPGNNTGTATETPKYADLGVKKTSSNVSPNVGEVITYTVSLFNLGTAAATNVQVTDALPANVQFVSATAAGGTVFTKTATGGVWNVPSIAPGQTLLLTLRVKALTAVTGFNTVTITKSDVYDPNSKNDTAKTPTNPTEADLYLTKTVDNARPNVEENVTFTITVQNLGPSAAADVEVADILPSGLEYVSSTPSLGTYDPGTGVWDVTTSLPAFPATGSTQTLQVTAKVKNPVTGPATAQKNTATATTTTTDPDRDNDTDDVTVTPKQADVAITKTVSNPTPKVGDVITFTLTVANYGPDTATNVVANDVLPAGLTFVSATASQGSYTSGSGIWNVGTVASSVFPTLTIRARVDGPSPGTIPPMVTNRADVSATEYDPDQTNNRDAADETPQYADLAVQKDVDNATPNVGDVVAFTITLDNLGADPAGNVSVLDQLPSGLQFVSAVPSQGTYSATTGVWTVGTVDALDTQTLVILAKVLAPAAGGIPTTQTNTASVRTSDQYDPDLSNNSDSASETPRYADLDVDKVVSNDKPKLGETVTFTITLANNGINDATGVTIADKLPTGLSFVSATPAAGTSYDPVTGIWDVGTLANGSSRTLTIDAIVNTVFTVTNIASVSTANEYDPDKSNNQDGATIDPQSSFIVVGPDLGCDLGIESRAVRVIDPVTGVEWSRFFPFGSDFRGGVSIATADLLGTGEPVIVIGSGRGRPGEVRVFTQNGVELPAYRTQPYGSGYTLGINVAAGDVTGDGKPDIVTSQALGPVTVRGFAVDPSAVDPVNDKPAVSFAPFGGAFGAGATIATADLVPGGAQEILVGTGAGVRAQVRIFGGTGGSQLLKTILPFDNTFTGGVSVATGRINADLIPDIIVGAGNGGNGGSRVEIWDGNIAANAKLAAFAAFADSRKPNAAVFASSFDTNGDGIDDRLAVVQGAGGVTDEVREFTLTDTSTAPSPFPYKATLSQQIKQKAPMRIATLRR